LLKAKELSNKLYRPEQPGRLPGARLSGLLVKELEFRENFPISVYLIDRE
jgi:hypothetical protein